MSCTVSVSVRCAAVVYDRWLATTPSSVELVAGEIVRFDDLCCSSLFVSALKADFDFAAFVIDRYLVARVDVVIA